MNNKFDDNYVKSQFTEKSTWNPPAHTIPQKVHDIVSELKNEVNSLTTTRDKPNLTFRQCNALKNLKLKKHLIIKPAGW